MTSASRIDAQIDELRERWDLAVERDRPSDAAKVLAELEKLDPEEARWSQRLGEALRRLGRAHDAEAAFVRATERYVKQGFLPRAIAMAKLVASLNPQRADLLAQLQLEKSGAGATRPAGAVAKTTAPAAKPTAAAVKPPAPVAKSAAFVANATSSVARPALPPRAASLPPSRPVPLVRAEDSSLDEVRFFDLEGPSSLDLGLDVAIEAFEHPAAAAIADATLPAMREPAIDRLGAMNAVRLFEGLPREALLDLANATELVEHIPGAMLMMRDEPAYALYAIIDGTVRVTLRDAPSVFVGEGDVVGEGCLLDENQRQADVRAETDLMALRIDKAKLDEVTERHAVIGDALFQLLARRLVMNLLHASPLFAAFEPRVRLELAQLFEIRRAEAGTVLCARGKRSDGMYVLLSGHVMAVGDLAETRIARGAAFGHGSLLGATPAPMTICATTEAVLLRLPASKFAALAAGYPPVLAQLAETADQVPRASLLPD